MLDPERRTTIRVDFQTQVVLKNNGNTITSTLTRDLSLHGLYIESSETLPSGTEIKIEIDITGISSELILHMKGIIVREDAQKGMAVEFTELDIDTQIYLQLVVLHNAQGGFDH